MLLCTTLERAGRLGLGLEFEKCYVMAVPAIPVSTAENWTLPRKSMAVHIEGMAAITEGMAVITLRVWERHGSDH